MQFFRLQKLNRNKIAYCCIRRMFARAFGIFCCFCFYCCCYCCCCCWLLLRLPLLLLLLLLLLHYRLLVRAARCFFFPSNSLAKATCMVIDVVQEPSEKFRVRILKKCTWSPQDVLLLLLLSFLLWCSDNRRKNTRTRTP